MLLRFGGSGVCGMKSVSSMLYMYLYQTLVKYIIHSLIHCSELIRLNFSSSEQQYGRDSSGIINFMSFCFPGDIQLPESVVEAMQMQVSICIIL